MNPAAPIIKKQWARFVPEEILLRTSALHEPIANGGEGGEKNAFPTIPKNEAITLRGREICEPHPEALGMPVVRSGRRSSVGP